MMLKALLLAHLILERFVVRICKIISVKNIKHARQIGTKSIDF